MRGNPRKVKQFQALMVSHGFSLAQVIGNELETTLTALADKIGCKRTELSMVLNGHPHRIYGWIRDALARKLGLTRQEMDRLIDTYVDLREGQPTTQKRSKNAA